MKTEIAVDALMLPVVQALQGLLGLPMTEESKHLMVMEVMAVIFRLGDERLSPGRRSISGSGLSLNEIPSCDEELRKYLAEDREEGFRQDALADKHAEEQHAQWLANYEKEKE